MYKKLFAMLLAASGMALCAGTPKKIPLDWHPSWKADTVYEVEIDRAKLEKLAQALLEKETLYEDEIDVILGLKTAEEVDLEKKNKEGLFGKAEEIEENVEVKSEDSKDEEAFADFREIRNGKFLPEVEDLINDFSSNLNDVDEDEEEE